MSQNKPSKKSILTAGFLRENPVLVLMIGLCSTLAITTNINNALGMGLAVIFVLVASNVIISLIRNITPKEIRIPVYIVVIATLVKVVEMFLHAYVTSIYDALGTFLGLIVVNCIILGRAEAFASKNGPVDSALDGLGMGIGYSLVIISLIRNITPKEIRIPVYIVVIATLVKVVEMFLHAYVTSLYDALGTFLGLIVVNCIILGRAEAFASKNGPVDSALDGLGMGIGYSLVIILISLIRQVFSSGHLSLYNPLNLAPIFDVQLIPEGFTISTFATPAGAFITFALVIAASVAYTNHKNAKVKGVK